MLSRKVKSVLVTIAANANLFYIDTFKSRLGRYHEFQCNISAESGNGDLSWIVDSNKLHISSADKVSHTNGF